MQWCGKHASSTIERLFSARSVPTSYLEDNCCHSQSVIKCMYIQGLCQSRLSTEDHALSLVAPATTCNRFPFPALVGTLVASCPY
jgi:hypothetical protein